MWDHVTGSRWRRDVTLEVGVPGSRCVGSAGTDEMLSLGGPGIQGSKPTAAAGLEDAEQDCGDLRDRCGGGDGGHVLCRSAPVPPVLPGLGGTAVAGHSSEQIESMQPVKDRVIKITFNADVHASLHWNFRPQQTEIYLVPGETALAFYKAKNSTDKPVIGISTYNVIPYEAGQYFNKIQCFCFEEQRLNPHEEVDMPVFFFIDPEFAEDPRMASVENIMLSYTFFEAKEGHKLPVPGYN
ncbi:unnamed protein product [Ranitomeya imitator]|uniref:Cytochrome c oxidase copper chaperone COX11 n=1 Tax=Ranitomeya imitator TaxID=111125 RepID=A0ABN9MSJ0_9NEOB|nr:unnamed protein product [Ranitomeya imitator]